MAHPTVGPFPEFSGTFKPPAAPLLDYIYPDQTTLLVGPSFVGKSWFSLWTAFDLAQQAGFRTLIINTESNRKAEWYHRYHQLAPLFPDVAPDQLLYAPLPNGSLGDEDKVRMLTGWLENNPLDIDYVIVDSVSSATGKEPSNAEANILVRALEDIVTAAGCSGACVIGHNPLSSHERPSEYGAARNRQMGGQTYEGQFGIVIGFAPQQGRKQKEEPNVGRRTLTLRGNAIGERRLNVRMLFEERDGYGVMVGMERDDVSLIETIVSILKREDPEQRGMHYADIADHPLLDIKRRSSTASDFSDTVRSTMNRSTLVRKVAVGVYALATPTR